MMTRPAIRRMVGILGLTLASALPSAVMAQTRQFQNWVVGCDNAHVCTAIVFAEPSKAVAEPGIPLLQIRHHPLRDATPEIRIFDPGPAAEGTRLSKAVARLVVTPTGAEVAKGPETHVAEFEGNGGFRFSSSRARGILHALRTRSARITISIGDKQNLRVNTAGLDDALAHMDDRQELSDTPGALIRKPEGDLTDYLHPTPPDIETVEGAAFGEGFGSDIPPASLPSVPGCKPRPADDIVQGHALRGPSVLLRMDCADEAHNRLSAWYLRTGPSARASLHVWPGSADNRLPERALLANVEVLPNGGVIRATRFRATTKDCGRHERWAFTKAGTFELIERRDMPLCRTAGPAHWIVTYRADFVSPP
jgi:hypothetical protein